MKRQLLQRTLKSAGSLCIGHCRMMCARTRPSGAAPLSIAASAMPSRLSSPATGSFVSQKHPHLRSAQQPPKTASLEIRRYFESESAYHRVADETLDDIQDAVEVALEEHSSIHDEYEVVLASGVLNMTLPPHGTWVINKQTPNRQIWWSSPLSGPRRYEYEDGDWVFTRDESHSMTLKQAMQQEFQEIYGIELELE